MLITKFVEVPNTNIQEEVTNDFGYDLCYDMAQQFGFGTYTPNQKWMYDAQYIFLLNLVDKSRKMI